MTQTLAQLMTEHQALEEERNKNFYNRKFDKEASASKLSANIFKMVALMPGYSMGTFEHTWPDGETTKSNAIYKGDSPMHLTPFVKDVEYKLNGQILKSSPELLKRLRNLDNLPGGSKCQFLLTIRGEGDTLIAKQWKRKIPKKLTRIEVLICL